jgi:hypothetical protein
MLRLPRHLERGAKKIECSSRDIAKKTAAFLVPFFFGAFWHSSFSPCAGAAMTYVFLILWSYVVLVRRVSDFRQHVPLWATYSQPPPHPTPALLRVGV